MIRIRINNIILNTFNKALIDLPTPPSLSYFWNFGSLLGLCLVIQIITGIFLAMHYCSEVSLSFISINHIIKDINNGFILKFLHSNGASAFFVCVYIHIARGIYYGSYNKIHLWGVGIIIFLLMMITAFIGYVLPWGQMSFWGATVITNFVSAIPYIGDSILKWIWGGFSVNNPTLNRFYSFHYLFPFILSALVFIHIIFLHEKGSNNSLGISSHYDKIHFHFYYTSKDLYGFVVLILLLTVLVFLYPDALGDPENYIKANSLVTPVHIMPEWYFLYAYAILRAIPNKLGGVLGLVFSILVLFLLPYLNNSYFPSINFSPIRIFFFFLFIFNFFLLIWMGSKPVEEPFTFISQISSIFYFSYFLLIFPLIGFIENLIIYSINKNAKLSYTLSPSFT